MRKALLALIACSIVIGAFAMTSVASAEVVWHQAGKSDVSIGSGDTGTYRGDYHGMVKGDPNAPTIEVDHYHNTDKNALYSGYLENVIWTPEGRVVVTPP